MTKIRHSNRMQRNQGKRMLKVATRGQTTWKKGNIHGEGLWCCICSPVPWGKANHRRQRDLAALDAIQDALLQ